MTLFSKHNNTWGKKFKYLKDTADIFSLIGVLNEPTKTAGECVISERPVLKYTVLQTLKHI